MITDFNKIVKEWSYRVDNGQPNLNNSTHLYHLSEILTENKWPFEVIDELLQNLNEQKLTNKSLQTRIAGMSSDLSTPTNPKRMMEIYQIQNL